MSYQATASNSSIADPRRGAAGLSTPIRTSLVRVEAGVVAGSAKRGTGNARSETWTMFMTAEQFDTCCADDPLRFTDPLLFAQLKTEFEHVFHDTSERAHRFRLVWEFG